MQILIDGHKGWYSRLTASKTSGRLLQELQDEQHNTSVDKESTMEQAGCSSLAHPVTDAPCGSPAQHLAVGWEAPPCWLSIGCHERMPLLPLR